MRAPCGDGSHRRFPAGPEPAPPSGRVPEVASLARGQAPPPVCNDWITQSRRTDSCERCDCRAPPAPRPRGTRRPEAAPAGRRAGPGAPPPGRRAARDSRPPLPGAWLPVPLGLPSCSSAGAGGGLASAAASGEPRHGKGVLSHGARARKQLRAGRGGGAGSRRPPLPSAAARAKRMAPRVPGAATCRVGPSAGPARYRELSEPGPVTPAGSPGCAGYCLCL